MYTNLIQTYAWCNLHDFTWGWKGDDRPELLPSVRVGGGGGDRAEVVSKVQDPATGDMIFYGPNASQHVALYLGDGKMLEAPQSGSVVKVSDVRYSGMTPYAVRMVS